MKLLSYTEAKLLGICTSVRCNRLRIKAQNPFTNEWTKEQPITHRIEISSPAYFALYKQSQPFSLNERIKDIGDQLGRHIGREVLSEHGNVGKSFTDRTARYKVNNEYLVEIPQEWLFQPDERLVDYLANAAPKQ